MLTAPDIASIRACFPALDSGFAFLENAGGSQVPRSVANRIHGYLLNDYVQLGAGYEASKRATETVAEAHTFARALLNADGAGEVVLGASTSQLCQTLTDAYARTLRPGDEFIVAEHGHEANIGPWTRLEDRGAIVKTWRIDREAQRAHLPDLASLLSDRTRVVAVPHVSNLLGEIEDVRSIADMAHTAGARVVIDGVAYAPHRSIDVQELGADFYAFSTYKVYGPHMAAMFGTHEAWAELPSPNHFFIPYMPERFELGGVNHEGCAGLLGTRDYLEFLAPGSRGRDTVVRAFDTMHALERPLLARLMDWLASQSILRVVGSVDTGDDRVPTVSFVHLQKSSREIVEAVDRAGIGIRHGSMYSVRLCEALGLEPMDGVVRVSVVHYNTLDEIDRLIAAIERVV